MQVDVLYWRKLKCNICTILIDSKQYTQPKFCSSNFRIFVSPSELPEVPISSDNRRSTVSIV